MPLPDDVPVDRGNAARLVSGIPWFLRRLRHETAQNRVDPLVLNPLNIEEAERKKSVEKEMTEKKKMRKVRKEK